MVSGSLVGSQAVLGRGGDLHSPQAGWCPGAGFCRVQSETDSFRNTSCSLSFRNGPETWISIQIVLHSLLTLAFFR